MNSQTVYVVLSGEAYEGGDVESVHSTLKGATESALNKPTHFEGGWKSKGPNYWVNGCDFVEIVIKEVEV